MLQYSAGGVRHSSSYVLQLSSAVILCLPGSSLKFVWSSSGVGTERNYAYGNNHIIAHARNGKVLVDKVTEKTGFRATVRHVEFTELRDSGTKVKERNNVASYNINSK